VISAQPPDARRKRSRKPLSSRSPSLSPTHPSRANALGKAIPAATVQPFGSKSRMNRRPLFCRARRGVFGDRRGESQGVGLSGPGSCREPPGRDTEPAPTGGSLLIEIRRGRANLHSRNSGLRPPARDHDGTASLRARSPHDPEPREAKGQRGEARVSLLERDAQTHARAYGDSLSKNGSGSSMFSKRWPPSFVFRISMWACVGTLSARLTRRPAGRA
jgi:hypothetical protein